MKTIGIYIHIPFCVRKCSYCDFLSAPGDAKTQELYLHALCRQIKITAEQLKRNKLTGDEMKRNLEEGRVNEDIRVCSVFFGGGTPSIWPGTWIGEVLACLRAHFNLEPDAEITVECNPGTLDAQKLAAYRAAGVNRLSIGLQSANNDRLRELGRIHTWEEFLQSWKLVRDAGFHNVNIDLMSALPNQTLADYEETLQKVLELEPEHISAYSLIVEEGTPFYERELNLPDEDTEREMYYRTKELLQERGYERYEISNYAKPGFSCRHNLLYWSGVDYLGFGIGAASLYEGKRYKTLTDLKMYLQLLGGSVLDRADGEKNENENTFRAEEQGQIPAERLRVEERKASEQEQSLVEQLHVEERKAFEQEQMLVEQLHVEEQVLSEKDEMEEFCFLGLRRMAGIRLSAFETRFGIPFMKVYGDVVEKYTALGLLRQDGDILALTDAGIDVSNVVLAEFLF